MVMLGAVTIAGVALVTPAQAAHLGYVHVYSSDYDDARSWGKGWDACRAIYPNTKSIVWNGLVYDPSAPEDHTYDGQWECRDNP
jgi:hypothetical protein